MIEIVHTINLMHREDRLLSISKEAKYQGFALRIWEGVQGDITFKNINKAFRRIIQFAKDNGYEYVIIAEDDCVFHSYNSFGYYIKNRPESFDIYLGMVYSAEVNENRIMNGYSGNTLITVHSKFYDFYLNMPDNVHVDRYAGQFAYQNKYYVCYPYVCRQLNGFSDNKPGKYHNYDTYLEGKEFI